MTTTLCFLERVMDYKLIDRYKAFARHHYISGASQRMAMSSAKLKPPRRCNRPGSPPDYDTY